MLKDIRLQKIFRNFNTGEVKVADGQPRTLVVKISTPTPDRSKDTVQPQGMDAENFLKNPVVLFAHNYSDMPIARCTSLKVSDTGILATVQFPDEGVYDKADTIYEMYKQGFLNAWSIGFMPTDYDENSVGGYNFKTWELFEFSSVPVPDNPEALTVMRSKGIDVDAVVGKGGEDPKDEPKDGEPEGEKPDEETPTDPKEPADEPKDPKVADMSVAELKALLVPEKKDVNEVIALSYVLDELHYFIRAFQQAGVSQESIDKLQQALALVMEVTQMQAVLGEKTIKLKDFTVKSGRTISAKHEKMLQQACDHMNNAAKGVQEVLDSVAEQAAEEEGGKQTDKPLTKRLYSQITATQKQLKETDKQVGLTLRLFKTIKGESTKG